MAYSNLEETLIKKAKELFKKNPKVDFDTLAEEFISKHRNIDEMTLCACLTEAHEQLNK